MRPLAAVALSLALSFPLFAQNDSLADLNLSLGIDAHQTVNAGSRMVFPVTLHNSGPANAKNVRITFDIPPGATLESIYGDDTVCDDLAARPLQCRLLSEINPRENFVRGFILETSAPVVATTYTFRATVTADNDTVTWNNSVSATWVHEIIADLSVNLGPTRSVVDPGDAVTLTTDVVNFTSTLPPTNIVASYIATNATIESFDAPSWTCTIGANGATARCTTPLLDEGCRCGVVRLTLRTKADSAGTTAAVDVSVGSDLPETFIGNNTSRASVQTYHTIAVTSTADVGEGSLRNAIEEANQGCDAPPCKIVFAIREPLQAATPWHTIIPATPLPAITGKRVLVDATTQQKIDGDANPLGPEVAIDGRFAGRGLEVRTACEAMVQGLAIGNFLENQGLWMTREGDCIGAGNHVVRDNSIGVSPDGTTPWPNLRGLRLDTPSFVHVENNVISSNRFSGIWMWKGHATITRNRITGNGASGMLIGPLVSATIYDNTIALNREMGVALVRGSRDVSIVANSMRDNGGLGIDWGLDGVSPVDADDRDDATNAPVLLAARYDAGENRTYLTMSWKTSPLEAFGSNRYVLSFYANQSPDGEGEQRVASGFDETAQIDGTPFELWLFGDHRGQWITATGTRWQYVQIAGAPRTTQEGPVLGDAFLTSEMSNAVRVP